MDGSQSPSYVARKFLQRSAFHESHSRALPYIGGGYGAKLYAKLEPLCTVLARDHEERCVMRSREEEFLTDHETQSSDQIKTTIKDGSITAPQMRSLLGYRRYAEIAAHRAQVRIYVSGTVTHSQCLD
jgi:CO/xanthine dehydrogenase Mo-binding subunit